MSIMKLRTLLLLAAMALATSRTVAQDQDAEEAEAPPASEEPEQTPPARDGDADTKSASDDFVVPTEEIQADEEVTFPIDI
jgi:hypothetical protein